MFQLSRFLYCGTNCRGNRARTSNHEFEPAGDDHTDQAIRLVSKLSIGTAFDIEEHRQLVSALERFYVTHNAGFEGVEEVSPLSEVMLALNHDELLIEYYLPQHFPNELKLMVVTSRGTSVHSLSMEDILGPHIAFTLSGV